MTTPPWITPVVWMDRAELLRMYAFPPRRRLPRRWRRITRRQERRMRDVRLLWLAYDFAIARLRSPS